MVGAAPAAQRYCFWIELAAPDLQESAAFQAIGAGRLTECRDMLSSISWLDFVLYAPMARLYVLTEAGSEVDTSERDLHGAAFMDVGSVTERYEEIGGGRYLWGVGGGIRYRTPIGPFRFDTAWNPDRGIDDDDSVVFHFSLGYPF